MFFKKKEGVVVKNKELKDLKGTISIGYCRSHKTIIIFVNFEGYKQKHTRLLPLIHGFR